MKGEEHAQTFQFHVHKIISHIDKQPLAGFLGRDADLRFPEPGSSVTFRDGNKELGRRGDHMGELVMGGTETFEICQMGLELWIADLPPKLHLI